ncbi:hypothetical protein VM1G_08133 [Cytospora mali]|uniref:Transcription factor RfeG n=1 Tax=Cytospora mali TaxID=578113 RepID=A0A194W9K3_CYTMA|nr:hypothetical protein VM1G_08133 [Valsa mali]
MSSRRDHGGGTPSNAPPSNRQNEYFIPRDGIDREVITADICRYLGNDALVRPGTYEDKKSGRVIQGYFVTAYRNLTSAMIADLKADSARWEQERRNHSGARYSDSQNRFSGAASSQYDTSGAPYPSGSKRDSYASVPRYPGSDAPGYSASVGSTYPDNRQSSYGGQYPPQTTFPPQAADNRFATPGPAGAGVYGAQPYPSHPTNAQVPDQQPYIGGHYMQSRQPEYQDPRMVDASSSRAYTAPGSSYGTQGQAYYSAPHTQGSYPAQSGDPFVGRPPYPATTQADYVGSPTGQPIYQDQYEPQYENQTSPPPRAVPSTSSSSQAQTGNSGTSHARRGDRERDREADRHRRR